MPSKNSSEKISSQFKNYKITTAQQKIELAFSKSSNGASSEDSAFRAVEAG